ncbi:MAG: fibrobacter succinogenes major paralogous domain-containing protein [Prevotellaceae bacterium]|jgi:hypothetical protein|nr:fibrobacter succinogenes major paralogous domain-containing protein [Prevotellaceae bacterium]
MKKNVIMAVAILLITNLAFLNAQVTIGKDKAPENFSVLELVSASSNIGGLRLPQLDGIQRTTLENTFKNNLPLNEQAKGLTIFNTETKCVETWNGTFWISMCAPETLIVAIPPEKGGDTWGNAKWIGAFWKDNQTGERIVASKNSSPWSVEVDDPSGTGFWLTLDDNGGTDPALWTNNPHDAENYQLPTTRRTTILDKTGDILFRIGVTGTDTRTPSSAFKYPDNSYGKPPRYATITLTVGGTPYKLYCRQGEAADFVFTTTDDYNDPNHTATNPHPRSLAKKFSPYNLTGVELNETDKLAYSVGVRGGSFVNFPTKAGAFFQWAMPAGNNPTYAYHPTQPATTVPWSAVYYTSVYWETISATQETCPNGWRRPNDGITNNMAVTPTNLTTNYTANNIYNSEMRQSLYAVPKNGTNSMTETTGRAYGYYADGYFDRRPIVTGLGSSPIDNCAVSCDTRNVAYWGILFFNAANGNRSLFMPTAGSRGVTDGTLSAVGSYGYYWSSSAKDTSVAWTLNFYHGGAVWNSDYLGRATGLSVRCVSE